MKLYRFLWRNQMLKNVTGVMLLVILLSLMSCASGPKEMDKKAEIFFNAGTQALMTKDYTEALTNLLKANELQENNPEILNNLGMAYYFKGDTNLALKCLNKSLKLDPRNSDARMNVASVYYEEGKIQDAESLYLEVTKDLTYDKQARTYYNLGVIELEKKKNTTKAEGYFLQSLKEAEDYCPSHYKLGTIQFSRREFNKAYRSFRDATMGVCLNSPAAHYQQALTLIEMRKFTDARMKLDDVENRFRETTFAVQARTKMMELDELERRHKTLEARSPRKVIQSPEY